MNMSEEEVFSIVRHELCEVLRVKPERITPEARLFSDLGSESIDMLDLRFRLEKAFNLKITDAEIVDSLGEGLSNDEIDRKLTVQGVVMFVMQKLEPATV